MILPLMLRKWILALFFLLLSLYGDELTVDPPVIWEADCCPCPGDPAQYYPFQAVDHEVIVDLRNPVYCEGIITSEEGGILTAPGLRVQAEKIIYTRTPDILTIACEGSLLITYNEWVLVGDSLYYDFNTHSGYLINGKTAKSPWFVGGKEILLLPDGELIVLDGYFTTSEGEEHEIAIYCPRINLTDDRVVHAQDVTFRFKEVPLMWLPTFKYDLNKIGRSPFAVRFGWGGFTGSNISLLYHFLSWGDLKATARIDGFIGQGMGGGIETAYNPQGVPTKFFTRNYYAHDIALETRRRRDRYRFQGTFFDQIADITLDGMYDFVSDGQMAADYTTQDFELPTAGRTQIELRHQEPGWTANLFTRIRVNDFQSVNQELPTLAVDWHTFEVGQTGIYFDNAFRASYLDYVFSDDVRGSDFSAGRVATHPRLYRPIYLGPATLTPEAGFIGIGYSDSPGGRSAGQAVGEFGLRLETALAKSCAWWKHTLEPYIHYTYRTAPAVGIDKTHIFTINDAYARYNAFRFGIQNALFVKDVCGMRRPLWIDVWANAYFDESTIPRTIPKGYINIEWEPYKTLFVGMNSAWNFEHGQLDFYNGRVDWTLGENLAYGIEYRHRGRFDWRKADFYNFTLETVRNQQQLLSSALSDKRETILFRTFVRLNPDWTGKFSLRHGWNRFSNVTSSRSYLEYQVELATIVFQHWLLTFNYEKREADNSYSVSLKLK